MKTKQLANILIKILGLSLFVHAIAYVLSELIPTLQTIAHSISYPEKTFWNYSWIQIVSQVILMAIGIFLILKSREVAAFLFKHDEE